MMMAESRDLSVATYSVVSRMGTSRTVSILTGILGGPCAWASFTELARLQAVENRARSKDESKPAPKLTRCRQRALASLNTAVIFSSNQNMRSLDWPTVPKKPGPLLLD